MSPVFLQIRGRCPAFRRVYLLCLLGRDGVELRFLILLGVLIVVLRWRQGPLIPRRQRPSWPRACVLNNVIALLRIFCVVFKFRSLRHVWSSELLYITFCHLFTYTGCCYQLLQPELLKKHGCVQWQLSYRHLWRMNPRQFLSLNISVDTRAKNISIDVSILYCTGEITTVLQNLQRALEC